VGLQDAVKQPALGVIRVEPVLEAKDHRAQNSTGVLYCQAGRRWRAARIPLPAKAGSPLREG
jgi:hypothetical protein